MKMTSELKEIARAGGSIKISATKKMTSELKEIASCLTATASLTIVDANQKMTSELKEIARAGAGKVIFDFTT